ncbi:MAG: ZrgA family zinc uptake protein [Pseudomonadota bacterium]
MNHHKHPLHHTLPACLSLAIALLSADALAAENPGAHRHGHAQLQMAVEANRVELIFTSPAQNLAGFERDPRTPEEEKRLEDIAEWLGSQPLVDMNPGSCTVTEAEVHFSGAPHNGHQDEHHEEHGHDDRHHHDHHGHDDHEQEGHRDYEVTQQLDCSDVSAGQTFTAEVMARFPEIEVLSVQWVSETAQGSARLEGGKTGFALKD